MKLTEKVQQFLEYKSTELASQYYSYVLSEFTEDGDRLIESPVEQLFYIEWRFRQLDQELAWELRPQERCKETGKYRIDFAVSLDEKFFIDEKYHSASTESLLKSPPLIGIEIDGHDWHEKTKEQVQYHKERERFLIANGWKLIRFTGSEVYRDPAKCVDEAIDIILPIRNQYHEEILDRTAKEIIYGR